MSDETNRNLKTKLDLLKACEDFSSEDALGAITFLRSTVWSMQPGKARANYAQKCADFMVDQGLVPLIVKMVRSLNTASGEPTRLSLKELHPLLYNICVMLKKPIAYPIREKMIEAGILHAFVEDLNRCNPNTKDPYERIRIINDIFRLLNMVLTPGAIPHYREAGAIPALMNFVKGDEMNTKVFSLRVLGSIINEEESQQLAAGSSVWDIVAMLRHAIRAPDRKYHYEVKTADGKVEKEFKTTLLVTTEGLGNLASNDVNKYAIVYNGGIPAIASILRADFTDEQNFAAAEALLKISFIDNLKYMVLNYLTEVDKKALSVIKSHRSSDTPKLRDVSKGLLHQLGLLELQQEAANKSPDSQTSTKETAEEKHIMISYNWDHQDRALAVRDKLREHGFNVWMDVDKMEGDILMAMANAVEKAEVVLLCISRAYKSSTNCQTEANYAYKRKKDIIPILVEKGYDADGWLGALIAMQLYARAYADDVFDQDFAAVLREIGERGKKAN